MKHLFFLILLGYFPLQSMESYSSKDGNKVPIDHKLIKLFNEKTNGVFFEVGANDGISQSNTLCLEKYYNWTGIMVEPSPNLYQRLLQNRPKSKCFECALGTHEENNTFVVGDFNGGLMSSVDAKRTNRTAKTKRTADIKVKMRSLQSILDESKIVHLDLLSLDTEGYEFNILKGIDFSLVTMDYLLIEIYKSDFINIVSFLKDNGYDLIKNFTNYTKKNSPRWDGLHNDYLFVRREFKESLQER